MNKEKVNESLSMETETGNPIVVTIREGLFTLSRGIGQVMFQNNAFSGVLMLSGLLCNSWQLALLAVLGNLVSTATALICKYNREAIKDGLFGFNGTLVGIAVGVFMEITWLSVLLLAFTSALSTWITWLFSLQQRLSGFTAPFILSVWILLIGCNWFGPSLLLTGAAAGITPSPDLPAAFCLNIGQVMFQGNTIWAGLFFLLAISINSRINAFYVILASSVSIGVALITGMDNAALNAGLIGYNGVLCAIVVGSKSLQSGLWAVLSVLISILLQWIGMQWNIITLTAPFVLSVWVVTILRDFLEKSR